VLTYPFWCSKNKENVSKDAKAADVKAAEEVKAVAEDEEEKEESPPSDDNSAGPSKALSKQAKLSKFSRLSENGGPRDAPDKAPSGALEAKDPSAGQSPP